MQMRNGLSGGRHASVPRPRLAGCRALFFGEKAFFSAFLLAFFRFLLYNTSEDTRALRRFPCGSPCPFRLKHSTSAKERSDTMNMKHALKSAAVSLALAFASITAFAAESVTDYVPSDASAVLYVNFKTLVNSPAFGSVMESFGVNLDEMLGELGLSDANSTNPWNLCSSSFSS